MENIKCQKDIGARWCSWPQGNIHTSCCFTDQQLVAVGIKAVLEKTVLVLPMQDWKQFTSKKKKKKISFENVSLGGKGTSDFG